MATLSEQKDFLKIGEPRILAVPTQESNEPLVDLNNFREILVDDSRKHIWNQNEPFALVRKSIAEKLISAQEKLPKNISFLVLEGYRSPTIQQEIFDWQMEEFTKEFPDLSQKALREKTAQFVAPPEDIPPHSTGGAVDLTIAKNGCSLDMGCAVNSGYDGACLSRTNQISDRAKANRKILFSALENVGLVNYPGEWWHWSYGDKYWAFCKNESTAIFGPAIP